MKTTTIGAALMLAAAATTQPTRAQNDTASTAQAVLSAAQPVHI
ncbi:hypothetical protein OKW50_004030 [Paraburkholderia youngii]